MRCSTHCAGRRSPIPLRDGSDFRRRRSGQDLRWELERLRSAGIRPVVAVDLTRPDFAIPVVRVVIPGLEGDIRHPHYVPDCGPTGPRHCHDERHFAESRHFCRAFVPTAHRPPDPRASTGAHRCGRRALPGGARRARDHRRGGRLFRGDTDCLAQGDPVGDGAGHPRLRQRQHRRPARRRTRTLRHDRGRTIYEAFRDGDPRETTTKSRYCTAPKNSATRPSPRRWSTSAPPSARQCSEE